MNVVLSLSFSAYHNEAPVLQTLLNKGNLLQFYLSIIIFLIIIFGGPFLLKYFGTYYNDPSIYIYLIVRTFVLFIVSTLLAFAPSVSFYSKHVVKMVYLSYLPMEFGAPSSVPPWECSVFVCTPPLWFDA